MAVSGELNTMKSFLKEIMKNNPSTRNSDTKLYLVACRELGAKTLNDLEKLNLNIITVHKIRQVIQNKEGLYLPEKDIKKERMSRNGQIKEYMARLSK